MALERNVGGLDRVARAVLGAGLLIATAVAVLAGRETLAAGAGLASAGLLFNAVVGWCGVNAFLGVNTCPRE